LSGVQARILRLLAANRSPESYLVSPEFASPAFPSLTRHFGSMRGAWPSVTPIQAP